MKRIYIKRQHNLTSIASKKSVPWLRGCAHDSTSSYLNLIIGFTVFIIMVATIHSVQIAMAQSDTQEETEPLVHIMQPGETLSDVAEIYAVTEEALRQFNGMTYVDFVFVGQPLRLPLDPETRLFDPALLLPTPTPLPVHVIQAGETLSQIAQRYGLSQAELRTENGIDNTDEIFVGQELRIQPASATGPIVLPSIPHTVKRGETLSEIAKERGVSTAEVMALNGISDPDAIKIGQVLEMPPRVMEEENLSETAPETAPEPAPYEESLAETNSTVESIAETIAITATLEPREPLKLDDEDPNQFSDQNLTTSLNRSYTVRSGDSLNRIALRNSVDLNTLMALNRLSSDDASALKIGQTIILPATLRETMAERNPASNEVSNESPDDANVYIVQPGDNLSTIASFYDLETSTLMSANGIVNADAIYVGQRLVIPPKPSPDIEENVEPAFALRKVRRGYNYYNVNPGDTLGQIAKQFDTTVMALVEYNGLPDEATVFKGLELRIPYGLPIWDQHLPPAPSSGTHFIVSISRQECWLLRGDYIDKAWRCSTGYGEWTTRLGSFQIKTRMELAQSSAHEMDMPFWLGIYDVGAFENGIHGLPVRWSDGKKVWSNLIGSPATYGCAMLNDENAEELFNESYLGMQVHIVE